MSNTDEPEQPANNQPPPDSEQRPRRLRRGAVPSTPEDLAAATPYEPGDSRDDTDPEDSK